MIPNSSLTHRLAERLGEQHRIRNRLNTIARPSLWPLVVTAPAAAFFMLVGDPLAITFTNGIDLPLNPPLLAGHFDRPLLRRLIFLRDHLVMQPPPGIDVGIGHPNLLDLLQIK